MAARIRLTANRLAEVAPGQPARWRTEAPDLWSDQPDVRSKVVRVVGFEVAERQPRRRETACQVVQGFEKNHEVGLEPPDFDFVRHQVVCTGVPGGAGVLNFDADAGMPGLEE